jgi:hypothetical protein
LSGRKMKKPTPKFVWSAFVIGSLSPIFALLVNPRDYPFYMFMPATPGTLWEQFRFFAGNSLLVLGFIVASFAAITLAARGVRQRRYLALLCPLVILANPLQQPIFLESLDTHVNCRMRDRADQLQIIGKTPGQVRRLLGKAHRVRTGAPRTTDLAGNVTREGETSTTWEYKPLPMYWLGSHFQVFFVDGRVKYHEANDD